MSRRRFIAAAIGAAVAAPAAAYTPTNVVQEIEWQPAGNRYTGTLDDALARFSSVFTPAQMAGLRDAVLANQWVAQVTITRDSIVTDKGSVQALPRIALMHFGLKTLALRVHREKWPAGHSEGALIYAVVGSRYALMRPAVCGNWCVVELTAAPAEVPCHQRTLLEAVVHGRTPESQRRPCRPAPVVAPEPEPIYGPGLRMALQPFGPIAPWGGTTGGPSVAPGTGFGVITADVRPAAANQVPEPGALALASLAALAAFVFTRKGL